MDSKNRVWFGNYPKGIIIYDPATGLATIPFPDDSVLQKKVNESNLRYTVIGTVWPGWYIGHRRDLGVNQLIPFHASPFDIPMMIISKYWIAVLP